MGEHGFDCLVIVTLSPQELLKVKGFHLIVSLVSDAVAFDGLVIDSQHRSAADNVELPILSKKLQRRSYIRMILNLIEENQRLMWNKAR